MLPSPLFLPLSSTMNAVYHEYKDKDQFLYMTYSGENVFGDEEEVEGVELA